LVLTALVGFCLWGVGLVLAWIWPARGDELAEEIEEL
jgi:hypothetical protein